MLTDPQLRSKVESLWDKLSTGGLSNPLDAIEQLSYLLFLKQLDSTRCLPIYFTVLMTFFAARVGRLKSGQKRLHVYEHRSLG